MYGFLYARTHARILVSAYLHIDFFFYMYVHVLIYVRAYADVFVVLFVHARVFSGGLIGRK